ncbi:hypothetical protein GCM10027396_30270 [Insolitispirillum peregrinum]
MTVLMDQRVSQIVGIDQTCPAYNRDIKGSRNRIVAERDDFVWVCQGISDELNGSASTTHLGSQ